MIRILIADDHAIVRDGLKQLLALDKDIIVAGEAANGGQVLSALRLGGVDIVLLDMTMSGISGESLISRILLQNNCPLILVFSMHNEPQVARRALSAGAAGYLTKDSGHELLRFAIRKVAAGGNFIQHELAEKLAFQHGSNKLAFQHDCLSSREMLIFRMLVNAPSINAVAEELCISNKTVSTHKARLMQKMGFDNNAQLMHYAITNGIA